MHYCKDSRLPLGSARWPLRAVAEQIVGIDINLSLSHNTIIIGVIITATNIISIILRDNISLFWVYLEIGNIIFRACAC